MNDAVVYDKFFWRQQQLPQGFKWVCCDRYEGHEDCHLFQSGNNSDGFRCIVAYPEDLVDGFKGLLFMIERGMTRADNPTYKEMEKGT